MTIADSELGPTASSGPSQPLKSALASKTSEAGRSRSRSVDVKSRSHSRSAAGPASPRRQIYEAKFDKFVANKLRKQHVEKRKETMKKEEFDITTKNPSSPSKKSRRFRKDSQSGTGKFDAEKLIPAGYEETLIR